MFPEAKHENLESLQVYDHIWKDTFDEDRINPTEVCQLCYEPVDQLDVDCCNECLREL